MKLQNLHGLTARVNHNAYDTHLEPYIGCQVQIAKKGKSYVKVVTDYGDGKSGTQKEDIENFDFDNLQTPQP